MTNSLVSKFVFSLIASVCLPCISAPAFAQRGGGGGVHGGGGFRGGGGAGFRGGGFSGGYRGMPAPRGGGAYVRSGVPGGYRAYAYPGSRSMRSGLWNGTGRVMAPWRSSRPANSDGRSSTFARRGSGPGAATPPPEVRSGANGGGWQSFSRSRGPAVESGPARGATAPNALAGRNSISQASALSAIHRSFGVSDVGNLRSGLRSGLNAPRSASSGSGSSLVARSRGTPSIRGTGLRNSSSAGTALNRFGSRNLNRFGNFGRFRFGDFDNDFDDFFFRRPFFGCCGFGFGGFGFGGFGFAIGFSGFDFGFGAPLWWGSGWPGWYGGPGYPYGLPYGYSLPYDFGLTYDSPTASGPPSDDSSVSGAYRRTRKNSENSSAILLLYLKDGTMYSVGDCWLATGELHCIATDRSEDVFELSAIDFQRTVDENAKRGVPFILKANPTRSLPH
jgi:hypothetical protein